MPKPLPELIIWGGTGNMKVLCELLKDQYQILGYFDNNPAVVQQYRGIQNLGTRKDFEKWVKTLKGNLPAFIVSIGPGKGDIRRSIQEDLQSFGLHPAKAIHRTAFVADNASIGAGSQVYANATVCVDVKIGEACLINTRASIDHECVLENGSSVGPGATLAGLVHVGENADIYTGAVLLPRVRIGAGATVGAGAVVRKDVPEGAVVVGNPARILSKS